MIVTFYQRRPTKSSTVSYDETANRRLWEVSLKWVHVDSDPSRPPPP